MRISALIIVTLIVSSSAAAVSLPNEERISTESLSLSFQGPSIRDDGLFMTVLMQGAPACVYSPGKPVLPLYTTTLELPFGSTIRDTTIHFNEVKTMNLTKKITPAPYPFIGGTTTEPSPVQGDDTVYGSKELYPTQWVTYTTGGGLNEQHTHVTLLTLQVFPVRYSPQNDTLLYLNECQITITYKPPTRSPFPNNALYDLVIITPAQFVRPLERLADHKNTHGIRTQIKTLEEIYQEHP